MGVILLDTHVVLWALAAPDRIPEVVTARLQDRSETLLVSAVSAMEVATKTRLGKLNAHALVETWSRRLAEIGATELSLTAGHALTAGTMTWSHRDPFDRLLAAQAIHEGAVLVTVDRAFADLTAPRTLTW